MHDTLFAGRVPGAAVANIDPAILDEIDAVDWSASSVGPVSDWQPAFRETARMMLASLQPMVMLMGADGTLIYNRAYAEFAGSRHPGILGRPHALAWPEIADYNNDIFHQVLSGQTVTRRDHLLQLNRRGAMEDVWLDLEYSPVLDERGTPIGELVIFSETTGKVIATRALRRAEERFSFAEAASGMIGIWEWDVSGDRVQADHRFAEMYGVDPDLAAGGAPISAFVDGVHPDDRSLLNDAIDGALAQNGDLRCEYRLVSPDGRVTWVLALGRVIHNAATGSLRLPGVAIDITREKEAAAALLASETRFRVLADTMPQMVWSTLPDGFHDYYNARWYEFTGVADGSTDGEGWAGIFHPDDQPRAWEAWRRSLATGEPYQIEYRLRHHTGQYRWTLGRALPIRDADGAILRWIGTCTDIHETRLAAEEREIVTQELSHRIKNIFSVLTGIIGLSARSHPQSRDFADELRQRIVAMGKAYDYVRPQELDARSSGSTSLHGLLERLLEPYRTSDAGRIRIEGDDVAIDEAASTPLALIFHELATNAAKYGALSVDGGRIAIVSSRSGAAHHLRWIETGAPTPRAEHDRPMGFGSRLLELSVRGQMGGEIEREWKADGLSIAMTLPLAALQRTGKIGRDQ